MATTPTKSTKATAAAAPVDDVDQADVVDVEQLPVGTVVRIPGAHDEQAPRYALVVGYGDPVDEHVEVDQTGRQVTVAAVPGGHPLLLDLHGAPREHQSGIERL